MTVEEAQSRAKGKELPENMDFDDGKMLKRVNKDEILLKDHEKASSRPVDKAKELELLAKKNPDVARFVSLGRFAQVLCSRLYISFGSYHHTL